MLLKEIFNKTPKSLELHLDDIVASAQNVYDEWDEDVDVYAGGGICHLIADAICDYLYEQNFECSTVSQSIGEVHVYTVVKIPEGVYCIDIPPSTYESGGGYSWEKIPNVEFDKHDLIIDMIDPDPNTFEDYIDSY